MKISTIASCFRCAETGEVFILDPSDYRLFYSLDGMKYFELKQTGFNGTRYKYTLSYEDPHHKKGGVLKRYGGTLSWVGRQFELTNTPEQIDATELPTIREPEYLFKLRRNYIYVSHDRYNYSYSSFKLFMGPASGLILIPIIDVTRYRDGGTTYIRTVGGTLFVPSPLNKDMKPTWKDEPIKKIFPGRYVIKETGGTVKIARKKP